MIELYTADTPNGKKISIMLEEIGYEYKVTKVDLGNNDQFKPEFIKLSPFSKIPVITDHDNNESIFESGVILMYLGEKSGKYYDQQNRLKDFKFLAGEKYTIADIATWPWIARHEWHDIGLKNYKNLSRWYLEIAERDAVIKGYSFMDKNSKIPGII